MSRTINFLPVPIIANDTIVYPVAPFRLLIIDNYKKYNYNFNNLKLSNEQHAHMNNILYVYICHRSFPDFVVE